MIIESRTLSPLSSRLPRFLTDLVGREEESARVVDLVARQHARLVTITGPGGVGKTRVVTDAGLTLQQDHGLTVAWIQLSTVDDHRQLERVMIEALGVPDTPGLSPADALRAAIADDTVCIILDNFEQIIDAAPRVVDLLLDCTGLHILITSRERLRVRGEREIAIEPLATPEVGRWLPVPAVEEAEASPAVQLFVDRARESIPGFQLSPNNVQWVVEICYRLDGLPLALELAAARLRTMPVESLAARLRERAQDLASNSRDLPARQHTLAATIDWSYQLLTPGEQAVFRRLAPFRGGFSLEAVEGVLGDLERSDPGLSVMEAMSSLVEKNLVRQLIDPEGVRPPRFLLLWSIRDFAEEQLARLGERDLARERHARWYLSRLEEIWELPNIGWVPAEELDRVERNHHNLWRAYQWFIERGDEEARLRLSALVAPLWIARAYRNLGIEVLTADLAETSAERTRPESRAAALYSLGMMTRSHGDRDDAVRVMREALALYASIEHERGTAAAELSLGIILRTIGRLNEAIVHLQAAVAAFDRMGDNLWRCVAERDLAMAMVWNGVIDEGTALADRALAGFQHAGNQWGIVVTRMVLVRAALLANRLDDAQSLATIALDEATALGVPEILMDVLADCAVFGHRDGNRSGAAALLAAVRQECERTRYRFEQPEERWISDHSIEPAPATGDQEPVALDDLVAQARTLLHGEAPVAAAAAPAGVFADLTLREREVLELIAQGMSDREIGDMLSISHRTVMRHVANLLPKLEVSSRTAAAALWHQQIAAPPA